ncbi:chemotaxis protein CheW [Desulfuribacillus alkaliarsenatis]|uniref:Chemotaxis protein CheW n=1 Tax=Desulfuribacillus alkaliarsenatis TaxID=766136 RepID=A0A1E5G0Z9_9FIRM|nr:chemotaxis protein CheW [Desulfuribacillus alkaliarsenatis]OEF96588.1 chemotaxis protein CheW [Desulfuribacillus alkaliarsenatis]
MVQEQSLEIEHIDDVDTQKNKYLTFILEDETYGIDIGYVTEIIGIQPITVVPDMPKYIRGIINIRGRIIPVMDMRLRFQRKWKPYTERTCVIIIDIDDITIGFIVDEVSEVMVIPEEDIMPPPDLGEGSEKYIKAIGRVGNQVKMILDCEKLTTGE